MSSKDYLIHEEGKVSYESGVPRYEFFVKDHLGNVRQVIRAPEQAMRVATMEPDRAEEEEEEFGNIKESRQPAAAHNTTPGGYATAWLNAARNRTLGPNRTQEVQEGDSITLMVEGKYLDIKAGAIRPKDLLQPVEGAPASPLLTDLGQPISAGGVNQFLLFKALHLLITGIQQKPAPEAYLGYALYDADSNMYDQGRIVLSKKARNRHEELKTRIFVPKDGYIEAYVVNESDEDVWFDQFRILSTGPVIVQETHYDPWGVELQGLGYQQGGLKVNKYLYNGKEFNDHLGLNLFDYGARMYDASVGRWFVVDPLAELPSQIAHSPYVYAWNNPVGMIDPTGMAAEESDPGKKGEAPKEDWENLPMLPVVEVFAKSDQVYRPGVGFNLEHMKPQMGWEDEKKGNAVNGEIGSVRPYNNQYRTTPRTVSDFVKRFDGMTYDEIMLGNQSFLGIRYPNRLADSRYGFVWDPFNSGSGREIDMIHYLVVGKKGVMMGAANELKQLIQGVTGDNHAMGSAFHPQDLYSNRLGVEFFQKYGKMIEQNPTKIAQFIGQFLNDPARNRYRNILGR